MNSSVSMDRSSKEYYIALFAILFASFVAIKRRRLCIILKTLPRDMSYLIRTVSIAVMYFKYAFTKETVISLFRKLVAKHPDKVIIRFQDTIWTVKELDLYSNKMARIFRNKGYKKGEVVALMSLNRPEYIGIWLGLGKIGVVTAFINTNLHSQSLAHCINVAECKGFVFSYEFIEEVQEVRPSVGSNIEYMVFGGSNKNLGGGKSPNLANISDIDELLDSGWAWSCEINSDKFVEPQDKLWYIYTSGTTGLPKAAVVTHKKLVMVLACLKYGPKISSDDIIYNSLPLYHSSGSILGTLPALAYGATVVIREKFSATHYFDDCVRFKCTAALYIGEMCRYLLSTQSSKNDANHSLRMVFGNGLRSDVWQAFIDRFNIPAVFELYGSTEGNTNVMNFDGTVGAIGFIPQILPAFFHALKLIKYDETNGVPVRGKNGFCNECDPGESGLCIGLISKIFPMRDFQGYVESAESSKKIIRNVFKRGDCAFSTGDILYMDELGYLFFKDRIGDTFRWKGENVSTSEVEMIIQKFIGFKDCIVYGVQVGNLEGKAGMAAIVDPKNEIDLNDLAQNIDRSLPTYARPLFLRILQHAELTGTFKVKKTELKNEAFDPNQTQDRLYFKHPVDGFVPITDTLYFDIITGAIRI